MARTFVQAGRRRDFTPTLANSAGDLVYAEGHFGVIQDDAVLASGSDVARPLPVIMEGVWDLPAYTFLDTAVAQPAGRTIFGTPTYQATSAALSPYGSQPSGAIVVGELFATYAAGASYLRVRLATDDFLWQSAGAGATVLVPVKL